MAWSAGGRSLSPEFRHVFRETKGQKGCAPTKCCDTGGEKASGRRREAGETKQLKQSTLRL